MSMNKSETGMPEPVAAFMQLVDAFGSDPQRWPQDRLRAAEMLLHSSGADGLAVRRYLAEAAALDRVLDAAPVVDHTQTRLLAERIMATANSSSPPANIIAFNAAGQRSTKPSSASQSVGRSRTRSQQARFGRIGWAASAVLAE